MLLLVDGSSFLYRAFHALPPLANSRGEPTGAVYGVLKMLDKLLAEHRPERVAVVFDAPGRTFRDELYAPYKAHRPPMPEELAAQIEPLLEILRARGLPVLVVEGVEADDVIGTLARRAAAEGMEVLIATGDKDMAQLVGERVRLVNTQSERVLDARGVEERYGVPPALIPDYLALVGDSSDNIPGVPGVGPKTAARWLRQYGSLEGLLAHAGEIPGKAGERLREAGREQLLLARELATIRCDLDLPLEPAQLVPGQPDRERLRELYRRLEFRSWLAELEQEDPPEEEGRRRRAGYETVLDEAGLERWLARLEQAELISLDLETTSLDYMSAEVVGVALAVAPGEAAYLPLAHAYPGAPAQLDRERVLARLRPLLEDPARPKVGHNLKYDASVLANHGIRLRGIRHDSMLESYVLESTSRHDLDTLARRHLGRHSLRYEDVAGKGARQVPFQEVAVEEAAPYAAEDADLALRLHRRLWPRLEALPRLRAVYEELEVPLVPVLSRMERAGVLVDARRLEEQGRELAARLEALRAQAHELAGVAFNLDSPKQIQEVLYGRLGLRVPRKTPKGQPSTSESALQELLGEHPLVALILDYRALAKLKSTYTDRLPRQIHPRTGRVHTSYHQAVTATGRLSSSDPNLQNIPIRTPEGRRIRQAFVAPPGHLLLAADYSQIELRILAHLSGDEGLRRAFAEGRDIHTATAAELFGVAPEAVTPEQRRSAKAINFGLVYGMSAFGLARQLGIPQEQAQAYMERYFARYPGVPALMEALREQARRQGYVETLFGRRLHLPDIHARQQARRQYAERAAINAPMQGTAADIIKRAMIRLDAWAREREGVRMIMQVHDELVFEVREELAEEAARTVAGAMAEAAELAVPLEVEVGLGASWEEAH
ncbi:MAG: DNA polymerase I [Gammaproteobacteria bacterium]|nr:MAG: DNA polymerase I [Gammaproteobacteria bacterium]